MFARAAGLLSHPEAELSGRPTLIPLICAQSGGEPASTSPDCALDPSTLREALVFGLPAAI
jgi:hypothetical protein